MRSRLRVLVVDDEANIRTTLGRAIERQPDMAVVAEAEDGATALQLALLHSPDVILMDVTMPVLSGIDAVRCLRHQGVRTPVLFLTGDPGAVERARDIDHSRVILKAAGGIGETLAALRQVVSEPLTAERTSRARAGLRRKTSATETTSAGNGSPDIRTRRRSP